MKRVLREYMIWTYVIFYCFLLLIAIVMNVLKAQMLTNILIILSAWTSTFVFIVMFRKINPKGDLREYIKSQFREKIKISTVLWIILIQFSIFLGSLFFTSIDQNSPIKAQLATSWSTLLVTFGNHLIRGPLGEELGWRGYVLNELQKKFTPLKSAIIVGVVWGFWHTPLWFISSGYTGIQLVQYIICFLISIVSVSIIMTVFYNLNHNLVITMMIHQFFNYFMAIQIGDKLHTFAITTILYFIVAVVLILISYKKTQIRGLS